MRSSTASEPTLFGFPLNRLVAFAGPYVAIAAGVVADWLLVHVHLLGLFHTTHNQIASAITQVVVFGLTAALVWLGHQKWLDGFQKWAYGQFLQQSLAAPEPLAYQPMTLHSPSPALAVANDDINEDLLPGDELPPQAEGLEVADPSKIPADVGDGDAAVPDSAPESVGPLGSSVSGLAYKNRIRARDLVMQAAFLGLKHAPALHYTQDARRWDGIRKRLKAWRNDYPHYADCSAFATWCIWTGLSHFGVRDVVNGQNWTAGYTGTMVSRGKPVRREANIMRGDLALYGDPFGGTGHVAVCVGGGKVISFGSEAGPFLLDLHYRSDLREVRRYI